MVHTLKSLDMRHVWMPTHGKIDNKFFQMCFYASLTICLYQSELFASIVVLVLIRSSSYSKFLCQAMEMLSDTHNSIPIIVLVTDGAVEDERHICDVMKRRLMDKRKIFPRIYTFGIGALIFLNCSH